MSDALELSIVIPCLNEETTVGDVVAKGVASLARSPHSILDPHTWQGRILGGVHDQEGARGSEKPGKRPSRRSASVRHNHHPRTMETLNRS